MSRWGAEPILDSYGLVALIAAALVALLLVRPKFGQVSRRGWLCLLALRLAAIALVTLALVRPTWVTTLRTPRTSVLVLLLDASRSMQLPSGRQQESRWQAQTAALAKSRGPLAAWANQGELRVYAYDSRLKQLDSPDGTIPLPAIPSGDQTDIGTSLSEALRPEQGKRLAGVVLLGDGAVTAFEPQVETQEAARQVRDDFAAPLFTVTFGPAGDAAQARDVAVERLDEQYTVFVKNELVVRALIRIRGYVKQELPVELTLENSAGEKTLLGK
ncbi:MAG: VWA domain-containing protein, partial [Pirellulaceae bacterium]|nr:VWA domain-containing protein [Pirellulaceae bacterium]